MPLPPLSPSKVAFNDADANDDGKLSRAEFATYLAQQSPKGAHAAPRSSIHPINGPLRGAVQSPVGPVRGAFNTRRTVLKIEPVGVPMAIEGNKSNTRC